MVAHKKMKTMENSKAFIQKSFRSRLRSLRPGVVVSEKYQVEWFHWRNFGVLGKGGRLKEVITW